MKINSREINALETKRKIYETADRLFRKSGYDNVSVDSIVEAAGVSKGSFYVHFDSKDALVASWIDNYVKEVDLDYKAYIEAFDAKISASDILIPMIGKIVDVIVDHIGYNNMKTLYKVQITKTINTDTVLSYHRGLYKMFSDIISKGIKQGEFTADIPVDTLTRHLIMAIRGLTYEWCIRYPDFDLKEQALKHFEVLLAGIKKRN